MANSKITRLISHFRDEMNMFVKYKNDNKIAEIRINKMLYMNNIMNMSSMMDMGGMMNMSGMMGVNGMMNMSGMMGMGGMMNMNNMNYDINYYMHFTKINNMDFVKKTFQIGQKSEKKIILFRTENMYLPTLYYQYDPNLKEYSYSINYAFKTNISKSIPNPETPDQDNKVSYLDKYSIQVPGIFIFLLDQSDSMLINSIQLAKKILLLFMQSLPSGSYFQLIGFGSNFEKYNNTPVEYNEINKEKMIKIINNLKADKGKITLISDALIDIINDTSCTEINLNKYIFVLTDGEISDKEKCMTLVKNNYNKFRLNLIGIDADFGWNLIIDLAKLGKGSFSFVNVENIDEYEKIVGYNNKIKLLMNIGKMEMFIEVNKNEYDHMFNFCHILNDKIRNIYWSSDIDRIMSCIDKISVIEAIEALNMCLRSSLIDFKINFCSFEENYKNQIISYNTFNNFIYTDEINNISFILDEKNKIEIENIEELKMEIEGKDHVNIVKETIIFSKNKNIIKLKDGDDMAKMIVS